MKTNRSLSTLFLSMIVTLLLVSPAALGQSFRNVDDVAPSISANTGVPVDMNRFNLYISPAVHIMYNDGNKFCDILDANDNIVGRAHPRFYPVYNENLYRNLQDLQLTTYGADDLEPNTTYKLRTSETLWSTEDGSTYFPDPADLPTILHTFTTGADDVKPSVRLPSPIPDVSGADMVFRLSERVVKGTGNIKFEARVLLGLDKTFNVNSSDVVISTVTPTEGIPYSIATVTLDEPLVGDGTTTYYDVTFDDGVFVDMLGNTSDLTSILLKPEAYGEIDETAPTLTTSSPADNATDVDINIGTLTFNCSEDMMISSTPGTAGTSYYLELKRGTTVVKSFNVSSFDDVEINGSQITLKGIPELFLSTSYYVRYHGASGNPLVDLAGNPLLNFNANSDWNFITADPVVPAIVSKSPEHNTTNVAIDANIVINFDHPVFARNTGHTQRIRIYNTTSGNTIHEEFGMLFNDLSSRVTGLGTNQIVIDPINNFEPENSYDIIFSNAFEGETGGAFTEFNTLGDWTFTTSAPVDNTAPAIASFNPVDNATNVAIGANFVATFDEPIQHVSVGQVIVELYKNGVLETSINAGSSSASFSESALTIDFLADLEPSTNYNIRLRNIRDVAGNVYNMAASNTIWNFTTGAASNNAPTNITLSPSSIDENNAVNAVVGTLSTTDADAGDSHTYSLVSGTGSMDNVSFNINGSQLRASASFDFETKSSYSIRVQTNDGTATYQKQFTITINDGADVDVTPPVLVSLSPADDATDVALDAIFTATFDEPIQLAPGETQAIILYKNGNTDRFLSEGDEQLVVSENTLTINFTNDLLPNTNYAIWIKNSVSDLDENYNSSFNNSTTWNFTTEEAPDVAAPVIQSYSPLDGATTVATDANLVMTFDENVSTSYGTLTIYNDSDQVIESFGYGQTSLNITDNVVTINPTSDLPDDTDFYVLYSANFIKDASNNVIPALTDNTVWNFSTAALDTTNPTVQSFLPASGATDVAIDIGELVLTYDESIQLTASANVILRNFAGEIISQYSYSNSWTGLNIVGNEITMTLPEDLSYETSYYVQITGGSFEDLSGNNAAGLISASTWSFTTASAPDLTAPALVSISPADGATDVALNSNIVITFDEPVFQNGDPGVKANVKNYTENTVAPLSEAFASVTGWGTTTLTISYVSFNYQPNEEYGLWTYSDFITDEAGNGYNFDQNSHQFTTGSAPNIAPTNIALNSSNIDENNATNAVIGTLSTTDTDEGDTHTYSLVSGTGSTDNTSFNINGSELRASTVFDFETKSSYSIRVQTNDGTATYQKQFTITVNDVDDAVPTIVNTIPVDNALDVAADIETLTLETSEPIQLISSPGVAGTDYFLQLRLVTGENSSFVVKHFDVSAGDVEISGSTITVKNVPQLSYTSEYFWRYGGTTRIFEDAVGNKLPSFEYYFSTGENPNDVTSPVLQSISPAPNSTNAPIDGNFVFTFDENIQFVSGGTGRITIASGGQAIEYIDLGDPQVSINQNVLTVDPKRLLYIDNSYRITIALDFIEDLAGNHFFNYQYVADEFTTASTFTFGTSKSPEDDASSVPIDIGTFSVTFDTDIQKSGNGIYEVQLKRVSDNQIAKSWQISSEEVVVDGPTVTFNNVPELEPNTSYWIHKQYIESFTDLNDNEIWHPTYLNTHWNFTTGAAPNNAPTNIALSAAAIDENNAVNAVVGTLSTTDADGGDSHSYTLVSGTGSTDNASFNISGNQLRASAAFDFETKSSYSIRVQTNDGTATFQKQFTITVNDVDDTAPVLVSTTPADGATGVGINLLFTMTFDEPIAEPTAHQGSIDVIRGDGTPLRSFTINPSNITNGRVTISGNQVTLSITNSLMEYNTNYYITMDNNAIRDAAGNGMAAQTSTTWWNFTTGSAANNAPTNIALDETVIDENNATNAVIGTLSTTDADAGDSHTYSLVSGTGSTDNSSFNINGNQLRASVKFDFETKSSYHIRVETSDGTATYQKEFTITVNNVAEDEIAPTVASTSPADDATGVSVNLGTYTFNMSEPVKMGIDPGIAGTNYYLELQILPSQAVVKSFDVTSADVAFSGSAVTLENLPQLQYDTKYRVRYYRNGKEAITDLADNPLPTYNSTGAFEFTTEEPETVAPTIVSSTLDGAVINQPHLEFTIHFSEPVNFETGLGMFRFIRTASGYSYDLLYSVEEIGEDFITFHYPNHLANGLDYHLLIDANAVKDLVGNPFAGISNDTDHTFSTSWEEPVHTYAPMRGATEVPIDADIRITFDRNITTGPGAGLGSFDLLLLYTSNFDHVEKLYLDASNITIGEDYLLYEPSEPLAYGTEYRVNIPSHIITTAGDEGATWAGNGTGTYWTFTTERAPQVITIEPISDKSISDAPFAVEAIAESSSGLTYEVTGPATINASGLLTLSGAAGIVVVTVSNDGDTQYLGTTASISFNVIDESLQNQTIAFSIADHTYGQTVSLNGAASSTLAVLYEIVSGPVSLSGNELTLTGVGSASIRAIQAGDGSFNPAAPVTVSFTINKAPLTITAEDKSMVFGESLPALTMSHSGFVNGEGASSITLPTISTTATATSEAGTYPITLTGGEADNYTLQLVDGTLEISPAPATVTTVPDRLVVQVYPNPAATWLAIAGIEAPEVRADFFNLSGVLVKTNTLPSSERLVVDDLSNGLYYLRLSTPAMTTTTKILIQR